MLKRIQALFKKKKPVVQVVVPAAPAYFDADYYNQQYPEVAQAGMQAWWHFYHHGYGEGRWPCALQSVQIEPLLWGTDYLKAEKKLCALLQADNEAEKSSAAWFLARWYAAKEDWVSVEQVLPVYIQSVKPIPGLLGPKLLWLEVLRQTNTKQAKCYLQQLQQQYGQRVDLCLAQMNLQTADKNNAWWHLLNDHYAQLNLMGISVVPKEQISLFDCLASSGTDRQETALEQGLVSVIVPAYNAEQTIETAIKGLLAQTWRNLEIIVVDDASTDHTIALVKKLAKKDDRVRLIQQEQNQGAYTTRNVGLAHSQGQFITVHDSDDWSHPQKIEQQVQPLLVKPELQGTLSHWVRTSETLFFGSWGSPEDWNDLVHRNVSSLLIRRKVFEELGFWDAVVCSADTEYYYRIMAAYGPQALYEVHAGVPLAFGRVRADSLTQSSETHIFSIFGGLRHRYRQAYVQWHTSSQGLQELYMPQHPDRRVFNVDSGMLRG